MYIYIYIYHSNGFGLWLMVYATLCNYMVIQLLPTMIHNVEVSVIMGIPSVLIQVMDDHDLVLKPIATLAIVSGKSDKGPFSMDCLATFSL